MHTSDTARKRRIAIELLLIVLGAGLLPVVAVPLLRGEQVPTDIVGLFRSFGWAESILTAVLLSIGGALFAIDRWADATRDRARALAAERALQESETHYRLLFDNARDAIILEDEHEQILDANPAASALFGYPHAELLHMSTRQLQPGPRSGPILAIYADPEGNPSLTRISTGRHRDGTHIQMEISMTAYVAGGRRVFLSIVRDITERTLAEEALRAEHTRAQRYLDVAGVILLVIGADERVALINRKGAEVLGLPESEIVGKDWVEAFVPRRQRERTRGAIRALLSDAPNAPEYVENAVRTSDGRERVIAWHNVVLHDQDGGGTAVLSSGEDITVQRRLEDQLRQARKMEAIGQLAGGVAHEFNNLLQVINGYSDFALESLRPEDPARADIQEVRAAGSRAAELTQQMLAFSRRQEHRPRVLELREVLEGMGKMLRPIIGEDVSLHLQIAEDLGCVYADVVQLTQALLNLAVNARDAIRATGEPGTITLEASNCDVDAGLAHMLGVQPGPYARILCADNGIGMSADVLEHLYEPFFTTKRPGQGTGLGLSAVYGIVRQAGGGIDVQSALQHGTRFTLYLPRIRSTGRPPSPWVREVPLEGGNETILVIEDDAGVRDLTSRLLSRLGYTVVQAASAQQAIDYVEAGEQPPDLCWQTSYCPTRPDPRPSPTCNGAATRCARYT